MAPGGGETPGAAGRAEGEAPPDTSGMVAPTISAAASRQAFDAGGGASSLQAAAAGTAPPAAGADSQPAAGAAGGDSPGAKRRCCQHIHEMPPLAPSWVRLLSAAVYLGTAILAVVALLPELAGSQLTVPVPGDPNFPMVAIILGIGLPQYFLESALCYFSIVPLWSWKPYYVLQHHFVAAILCTTLNLQVFVDPQLWLSLVKSQQSYRLIGLSCGFTGVNECFWVLRSFAADPKSERVVTIATVLGMFVLIQNIGVCVPGLALYCINGLWPLWKDTSSGLALFQIIWNGVLQGIGFHLYLQVTFLRLQYKKLRRLFGRKRAKVKDQSCKLGDEESAHPSVFGRPVDAAGGDEYGGRRLSCKGAFGPLVEVPAA